MNTDARYRVVVTKRVSYFDGSSVATRFGIADGFNANRVTGNYVSRDVAQIHAAALNEGRVRFCAAWLDCGNRAVPVADISFRGFCPECEAVANSQGTPA